MGRDAQLKANASAHLRCTATLTERTSMENTPAAAPARVMAAAMQHSYAPGRRMGNRVSSLYGVAMVQTHSIAICGEAQKWLRSIARRTPRILEQVAS
eukprot:1929404-Amphidinium_carterae.1